MSNEVVKVQDHPVERIAQAIARSGLFGFKSIEQAVALCFIAQAEGRHPASCANDYHIIEGRPALKADTILSRFQAAGGSVKWTCLTDEKVTGKFSHPQGGEVEITWDIPRAKKAEVWKEKTKNGFTGMWIKYPRQMLRARVISEGVRCVFPGVMSGMSTPEEVADYVDAEPPRMVDVAVVTPADTAPAASSTETAAPTVPKCDCCGVSGIDIILDDNDLCEQCRKPAPKPRMATPKQVIVTNDLLKDLANHKDNPLSKEQFLEWRKSKYKVDSTKDLTRQQADEVIDALEAIQSGRQKGLPF